MINKIKQLSHLSEKLELLTETLTTTNLKIEDIKKQIDNQDASIKSLTETTAKLDQINRKFHDSFMDNINNVKENNDRFQKLLTEFSLLKSKMPEKLFDRLHQELEPNLNRMKSDQNQFDTLNSSFKNVTHDLNKVQDELKRFQSISKGIKDVDFELVKYKKTLETEDRNKVSMLKQINDLKTMIAKERMRKRN